MSNDVTLEDVARSSGVSMATASRAMNAKDGVRPDVRERVQLVANALGYRPNRAAKNLAGGRTSVVGLVLGSQLRNRPYASSMVEAVGAAASNHDEGLMLIMDSKAPTETVRRILSDGLIEGVVISAVAIGEQWVEQLLDASIPTILVGAHPRRTDVHVVDVDNLAAGQAAVDHLFDRGHRRIATITGKTFRVDASLRLAGYREAHRLCNVELDENLIVSGDFSRATGYRLADDLFALDPDAIFAANDEMALGIMARASERGISIPDDVSLIGFDGIAAIHGRVFAGEIRLSSMAQPFELLGETAILSLVALINGETVAAEQLLQSPLLDLDTVSTRT